MRHRITESDIRRITRKILNESEPYARELGEIIDKSFEESLRPDINAHIKSMLDKAKFNAVNQKIDELKQNLEDYIIMLVEQGGLG